MIEISNVPDFYIVFYISLKIIIWKAQGVPQ